MRHQGSAHPAAGGTARGHDNGPRYRGARSHDHTRAGREEALSVFAYRDGELHAEDVPLSAIAAQFGTPCYVYSRAAIAAAYRDYSAGFADLPHLVCYAMKANSNLAVLKLLADLGSGFDIVSIGELARVLAVGGDPAKVSFPASARRRPKWPMR